jgi:hypothetical protein
MMMRMLAAAGVPILSDGVRAPDEDNPNGYFELEAAKATAQDASWVKLARGHAVKLVHALVRHLPPGNDYKLIMMHRVLDEVIASQDKMLNRSGRRGATMDAATLKRVYKSQLDGVRAWIDSQPNFACLDVHYADVIRQPAEQARRVAEFVGIPYAHQLMTAAVDPSLYRNRS